MAGFSRRLIAVFGTCGLTLLLLPESLTLAQNISPPARGGALQQMTGSPAVPVPVVPPPPVNMLQQPAHEAQVAFSGDLLSIHADNSSLAAILRLVAAESGMNFTGLGSDERVFGTFGPAAPRDVLADLLNGTAYDLVLVGNASHGAPRELILTPAKAGAPTQSLASAASSRAATEEAVNDQETPEAPPSPDVPPPASAVPAGVRTPQQLFQQLQQMRQAQQQQIPQQEQQQTQTPQQ